MSVHDSSADMKHRLGTELKKRMASRSPDKITIKELTDACGVNRQTFYYHFKDIYDLLEWVCRDECVSVMKLQDSSVSWQDSVGKLLTYVTENKAFCACIMRSVGHMSLKNFFSSDMDSLIRKVISSYAAEERIAAASGGSTGKMYDIYIHFYSVALASMLEEWILDEVELTPEEFISCMEFTVINNLRGLAFGKLASEKII